MPESTTAIDLSRHIARLEHLLYNVYAEVVNSSDPARNILPKRLAQEIHDLVVGMQDARVGIWERWDR